MPLRSCIGCGQVKEKQRLIRLCASREGEVLIDLEQKMPGRGIYVCYDNRCIYKGVKGDRVSRGLRRTVLPVEPSQFRKEAIRRIEDRVRLILKKSWRSGLLLKGTASREGGPLGIIARDASLKRKQSLLKYCRHRGLEFIEVGTKRELGALIGEREQSFLVLVDGEAKERLKEEIYWLEGLKDEQYHKGS